MSLPRRIKIELDETFLDETMAEIREHVVRLTTSRAKKPKAGYVEIWTPYGRTVVVIQRAAP